MRLRRSLPALLLGVSLLAAPRPSRAATPGQVLTLTLASDDDGDDEDRPKRKRSSDDDDEDRPKRRSSDEASSRDSHDPADDEPPPRGWGVISSQGPNGRAVHAELGIPGLRVNYLASKSEEIVYGGGGELDFSPLSGAHHSPYGFNGLRFLGAFYYNASIDETFGYYLHFDPSYIIVFGSSAYGVFEMPLAFGVGANLGRAHLCADLGINFGLFGSLPFPFGSFVATLPFVGVGAEYPLTDELALTVRLRLQTNVLAIGAGVFGPGAEGFSASPTLFGTGYAMAGVAYRFE